MINLPRAFFVSLSVLALGLFSACTTVVPESTRARQAPESPRLATVYLFSEMPASSVAWADVVVDVRTHYRLEAKSYTWFQVPEGAHLVEVYASGKLVALRSLVLAPGQVERVPVAWNVHLNSEMPTFGKVTPGGTTVEPISKPVVLGSLSEDAASSYLQSFRLVDASAK